MRSEITDTSCIKYPIVVDDGYKIAVYTSAEFKVFPPLLPTNLHIKPLNLGYKNNKRLILQDFDSRVNF